MSAVVGRLARLNPFRASRVLQLRYRLSDAGWQVLLDRLTRLDYRGALVGPRGSGKSTLLEDLEGRLEARGWRVLRLRLSEERMRLSEDEWRRFAGAGAGDLLSLDGAEQLSWWRWRQLEGRSRQAGGMVVTTHRPGRLSCLREHRTSQQLLRELVESLVGRQEAERLEPQLERLFATHRGNLRDCLRDLYDGWAAAPRLSSTN